MMGPTVAESLPIHHSHLNSARRCLRQYRYAYVEGLTPRQPTLPLARGLWIHYCLAAAHIADGLAKDSLLEVPQTIDIDDVGPVAIDHDQASLVVPHTPNRKEQSYPLSWQGMLQLLVEHAWMRLFPEEQQGYVEHGHTLPQAVEKILRGYFYHYRTTLEAEAPLLVEFPWQRTHESGHTFAGQVDLLARDSRGMVVLRDWKSSKSAPKASWKLMESQLHLYPWGLQPTLDEHGISIDYIEFDYLLTKPPTKPAQNKDGSLSKRAIDTDALTYLEALKEYGIEITGEHKRKLAELKHHNPFLERTPAPRNKGVTEQILAEAVQTASEMKQVHQRPHVGQVRTVKQSCEWDCPYTELCMAELWGHDTHSLRQRGFHQPTHTQNGNAKGA